MKPAVLALFIFLLFYSCGSPTTSSASKKAEGPAIAGTDTLETKALRLLFDKLTGYPKIKSKLALRDNKILLGDDAIQIKITPEFDGERQGQQVYAASFVTTYTAKQQSKIVIGSIGIGASSNEARDISIEEWFGSFGMAFINMLADTLYINMPHMKVYPGLMGIRGRLPENTWLKGDDDMNKRIITQINPQLIRAGKTITPVDIKLLIGTNGVDGGECKLNNRVSDDLLNELKKLSWPSPDNSFMFKQFYLVENE